VNVYLSPHSGFAMTAPHSSAAPRQSRGLGFSEKWTEYVWAQMYVRKCIFSQHDCGQVRVQDTSSVRKAASDVSWNGQDTYV